MITDLDKIMLSEEECKRIDERCAGCGIKGRKPDSYLKRLKKLYEQGFNVSGCHSIPNYGHLDTTTRILVDTKAHREAYEDWRATRRYDNLHGTISYDEIVEDEDGNEWSILCCKQDQELQESIMSARQRGQEVSVTNRKSVAATNTLIEQYKKANPNQKALVATKIADWAVEVGKSPEGKNERRNLIARLKRNGAS